MSRVYLPTFWLILMVNVSKYPSPEDPMGDFWMHFTWRARFARALVKDSARSSSAAAWALCSSWSCKNFLKTEFCPLFLGVFRIKADHKMEHATVPSTSNYIKLPKIPWLGWNQSTNRRILLKNGARARKKSKPPGAPRSTNLLVIYIYIHV